jgi:site-specific DNA-methyltransferase (adenine-specific)
VSVIIGDCLTVMPTLAACSVDAIVCDPPYHLTNKGGGPHGEGLGNAYGRAQAGAKSTGFMGKAWDGGDVALRSETWAEALRVAKPGAHLLAFGGTRTHHRLMCAIEDAGWEIRDVIMWVYGSGFPKSHNGPWGGTALKPAWEPIILARKPLIGTVAANVQQHGTGALNIDGCRVGWANDSEAAEVDARCSPNSRITGRAQGEAIGPAGGEVNVSSIGRWPANLIHDGSDEVVALFPQTASGEPMGIKAGGQGNAFGVYAGGIPVTGFGDAGSAARFFYCAKASREDRNSGLHGMPERLAVEAGGIRTIAPGTKGGYGSPQSNHHPTVKPTDLMRYLCRLVTPPGGLILDPFAGSGSTGKAAAFEGFRFLGIELDPEYAEIAEARIRGVAPLFAQEAAP